MVERSAAVDQFDPRQLVGAQLIGLDGKRIGKIGQVFLDDQTGTPQWVSVQTGVFGGRNRFVPLSGARLANGHVEVPFSKDQVKDAPSIDADGDIGEAEEASLYRYYGLEQAALYSRLGEPSGGPGYVARDEPEGYDPSRPSVDDAIPRSQERRRAAAERVEGRRARVRRYVMTGQQASAAVKREETRAEHEPVRDANRDASGGG
jgi:sporulation protein YlmC with PRC-barrel domain